MSVRHNRSRSRYELDTEHGMAIAVYSVQGDKAVFTHTEVPPEDEGKGHGSTLVRAALEDTRRRGLGVVAACSFVADFLRRHPDYAGARPSTSA